MSERKGVIPIKDIRQSFDTGLPPEKNNRGKLSKNTGKLGIFDNTLKFTKVRKALLKGKRPFLKKNPFPVKNVTKNLPI